MIDRFLGDAFGVLSCQFWNTVLQSSARLPILTLKLLNRAVSGARFLPGGVFERVKRCTLRCKAMYPLNGALPGPYVPVRVRRGALVTHRYTNAPPRCKTLQYSTTFIPLSVSLWNDLANPVFDGVGLAGFKSSANASLLA